LNVGSNEEVTIKELSIIIKEALNFEGSLEFDETKPDGNPRKLLDSTKIFELGWKPLVSLTQGIERTYSWFNENIS
jgi:GDP-L-fucose synthase